MASTQEVIQFSKCAHCGEPFPHRLLKLEGKTVFSLWCRKCKQVTVFNIEKRAADKPVK